MPLKGTADAASLPLFHTSTTHPSSSLVPHAREDHPLAELSFKILKSKVLREPQLHK